MAASNFDLSLKRVLVHEGGWSNHPNDPGGPTMKGVIQRVYDGYRDRKGLARQSVRNISEVELGEIYRRQFWDVVRGDDLPEGIDYVVFDGAVNSGPVQSAKWLQRALACSADGHIGEGTIDTLRMCGDYDQLVNGICDQRLRFLKSLRTWSTFGTGWGRRVSDVRRNGLAMASGSQAATPRPAVPDDPGIEEPMAKAPPPTPKESMIESKIGNGSATIGVGSAIETARQVNEAVSSSPGITDTLMKLASSPTFWIIVAVGLIAVYIWYDRRRKMKMENL